MPVEVKTVLGALHILGPQRSDVLRLIGADYLTRGPMWLQQPYLHEFGLVDINLGLKEKGGAMDVDDQHFLLTVFTWLNDLDIKRFPRSEWIPGRTGPLFLAGGERSLFRTMMHDLRQYNFLTSENYRQNLNGTLKYFSDSLVREGILAPDYDVLPSLKIQR